MVYRVVSFFLRGEDETASQFEIVPAEEARAIALRLYYEGPWEAFSLSEALTRDGAYAYIAEQL